MQGELHLIYSWLDFDGEIEDLSYEEAVAIIDNYFHLAYELYQDAYGACM